MQFDEVNWAPTLITLGIGAVVGIILVVNALRRKSGVRTQSEHALELRDLEGERDALVAELQELDDAAAKTSAEERGRMRYELELKLASTLRALRGERAAAREEVSASAALEADAAPADRFAAVRGFLWGIAGAAAVAGLIVFVLQTSEPKPQQEMSGAGQPQEAPLVSDAQLAQLRTAVESHPEDLDLRVDLAAAYLMRNQVMEVWNETSYVLERSPDHPRALSYAALVKLQMGEHGAAEEMLKTALKKDPTLLDGWTHLAIVYAQTGRMDDARAAIASARERHPEQSAMLDGFAHEIDQLEQRPAQQAAAAGVTEGPAGEGVTGVVEVKKGAASPQPSWSIFVIARDASAPAGPPVAVKRLSATAFPLAFTLDMRDSMMGNPLPAKMTIEARVDNDGNPMLSAAGEMSSPVEKVSLGEKNVQLVLQ